MSKINLMPGNWFELKNIDISKCESYNLSQFKSEILNQISNRAEKLDIIVSNYTSKKIESEDITFHIDKDKFKNLIQYQNKDTRHPIITFHGTSLQAVESILKNGYIISNLNSTNIVVKAATGSLYGTGVYSSPFFDKAMYYTKPANDKYVYILVNMLFLGTMKMIPPARQYTNFTVPINNTYADGSNTRVVYGLDQIISADTNRVIPIAVIKIKTKN